MTFAYPSRPDIQILNQFCLSVPSGSVTAIVGILFVILKHKKPRNTTLLSDIFDRRKPCSFTIFWPNEENSYLQCIRQNDLNV